MSDSTGNLITRRRLAQVATAVAAVPALARVRPAGARQPASPVAGPGGIAHRGVTYDCGVEFYYNAPNRPDSDRAYLRNELTAIRDELNCTSVGLYGSNVERLLEATDVALELGLHPWVQPRFIDEYTEFTIPKLVDFGRELEARMTSEQPIVFNIGCENAMFLSGIVPGRIFDDRVNTLINTIDQIPVYIDRLNSYLSEAVIAIRPNFSGQLTYSASEWEEIDWSWFDIIGIDFYKTADNQATYVDQLKQYLSMGKPLAITEFGCGCFKGSEELGGDTYTVVDYTQDPPRVPDWVVRDESVQADYVSELIDLYAAEGVHSAFVHNFIEPASPHNPEPEYDYDVASYGIVKTYGEDSEKPYAGTGYWEPKASFKAIAGIYGSLK